MNNAMNNAMNSTTADRELREALSALADGEALDAPQWQRLRRAWATHPSLRREWQLMHVTGDALRAPDLTPPAQSAEALLDGLRARLAREPVSVEQARQKRHEQRHEHRHEERHEGRKLRDLLPALAVAAGFVLVALIVPGNLRVTPNSGAMNMVAAAPAPNGSAVDGLSAPGDAFMSAEPTFAQALSPVAGQSQAQPPQLRNWPNDALSVAPQPARSAASVPAHATTASAPEQL